MNIFTASKEISNLKYELERMEDNYQMVKQDRDDNVRLYAREKEDMVHTHQLFEASLRAEMAREQLKTKLNLEAETQSLRNQVIRLEHEKKTLQSEVTMLREAFKSLGFDVKDMKELLNKLVDGVVSKNTVNVIKTS